MTSQGTSGQDVGLPNTSLLVKGNKALREKKYTDAIALYLLALKSTPELTKTITFNIGFARQKSSIDIDPQSSGVQESALALSVKDQLALVGSCEYFNADWYRGNYGDIRRKDADPLLHFLKSGGKEQRNPSPRFNTRWYVSQYQSACESDLNPLVHFLLFGQSKGYLPLPPAKVELWWDEICKMPQSHASDASISFERDMLRVLAKIEENGRSVCVVIPVYNAPDHLRACLNSVVLCSPEGTRIIAINDASPDPQVEEVFREFEGGIGIEFYRNETNLGFTRTVNKGFEIAGKSDVLLLNADTVVTAGWVRRLMLAAYSEPRVGTATPLSNNAGAFSAPVMGQENRIPSLGLEGFARAIAQCSVRLYPKTPTGNGFCMYIRQDCLEETGSFDADAFPRGYGEENDFCMRAGRKGWSHVVDDATYIYHVRSASFGEEKTGLIKTGRGVIDDRYPEYTATVRAFVRSDAMETVRGQTGRIADAISRFGVRVKPRVLFVLPDLSPRGGTPQTNQDLMLAISDRVETFFLRSNGFCVELFSFRSGQYVFLDSFLLPEPLAPFPHRSDAYDRKVASWLDVYAIELVHIRHIAWHGLGLIDVAKQSSVPVIFSFHDFYTVCPTIKLLDENNVYCGGFCTSSEGECKYDLWRGSSFPTLKHSGIFSWKQSMQEALLKCDVLVTTAKCAKSLILKHFDALVSAQFKVIPHGRDFPEFVQPAVSPYELNKTLRIIVPGNIGYAKGAGLIHGLSQLFDEKIEFHVLGRITEGGPIERVVEHGEYQREEFVSRVKEIQPHIGVVLSIWPETYCHTLTELWAAGIPVVGLALGAVGERLLETEAGWVVPDVSVDAVADILHRILSDPSEIAAKVSKVKDWQLGAGAKHNTAWMADQYHKLYSSIAPSSILGRFDATSADKISESLQSLSFRKSLCAFNSTAEFMTVSVIVPVHNAFTDVCNCLDALVENTFPVIELVVIDDGSDEETAQWVEAFSAKTPYVLYFRSETAQGYTRAVNKGAELASGEILVILNSDTIVPPYWLERLVGPFLIQPNAAATGPVSNAATWQSVPKIRNPDNTWAINSLPPQASVVDYDRFVQLHSEDLEATPVTLLNGFCYAVRASVFDEIGGLDEKAFPSGYGEENDFFLKIQDRGYSSILVPNLFVFHAKSKSFGAERRKHLSAAGNEVLYARYGKECISGAADTLAKCSALKTLRERCAAKEATFLFVHPKLKILFLMPVAAGGGGVHSVAQEAQGLAALGNSVTVIVPEKYARSFEHYYPELCQAGVFTTFATERDLVEESKRNDVIIATHFFSIRLLKKASVELQNRLFLYYVQDYEPWIVPEDSPHYQEALESYNTLNEAVLMAKTRWICRMVEDGHDTAMNKIAPSIDHSIYFPDANKPSVLGDRPLAISAMIRPKTPRRGAQATINILKALHGEFNENIRIELFGCTDQELNRLDGGVSLLKINHGILTREGVAELLRQSDLFIDLSTYQAFGRTAVEAMACGAAAVIPEKGGGTEFSWGGRAALPVPTDDIILASMMVSALVRDRRDLELRQRLGQRIATQFSIKKASISIQSLIERHISSDG